MKHERTTTIPWSKESPAIQPLIKSLGDSDFQPQRPGGSITTLLPVIPPPHHNHHDPHTKEVSRNAEASDGEASKTRKKIDGNRREMSNVEKGMIIAFFVIFGVISTVSSLVVDGQELSAPILQARHC